MKKYKLYQTNKNSILEVDGRCCILGELNSNRYYKIDCQFSDLGIKSFTVKEYMPQLIDYIVYFCIASIPLITLHMAVLIAKTYSANTMKLIGKVLVILVSLIINIVLHETAHFLAMKFYGLPNARFGMRREHRRIKFFVDTTSMYLLPPYKKIVVHSVGILTNFFFVYFALLLGYIFDVSITEFIISPIMLLIFNICPFFNKENDISSIIVLVKENFNKNI